MVVLELPVDGPAWPRSKLGPRQIQMGAIENSRVDVDVDVILYPDSIIIFDLGTRS